MIVQRKKLFTPTLYKRQVTIAGFKGGLYGELDDELLPLKCAKKSFNFESKNGALLDGGGVKQFEVDGVKLSLQTGVYPIKTYFYKRYDFDKKAEDDRLIVYASDGLCYEFRLFGGKEFLLLKDLSFSVAPIGINYRYNSEDVMLFSSGDGHICVYNGTAVKKAPCPSITSMCMHYERLYVTTGGEKSSLYFSDDFDPLNWEISLNEAGFIDMTDARGGLEKVVSFLGYVYIFRSYGISRLSAYGDQEEFSLYHLFVSSGKIYPKTVTECGDRILFLADDGLYSFSGYETTRIAKSLDNFLGSENSDAFGVFYQGKYYLSLNLTFDEKTQKYLLVYDKTDGSFHVINGINPLSFEVIKGSAKQELVVCTKDSRIGVLTRESRLFLKPLKKEWISPPTDLGYHYMEKHLKSIRFFTDSDMDVEVESECGKRKFSVKGKGEITRLDVMLKGTCFTFKFSTEKHHTRVSKLSAIFDVKVEV